jgi:hypothetical protein
LNEEVTLGQIIALDNFKAQRDYQKAMAIIIEEQQGRRQRD